MHFNIILWLVVQLCSYSSKLFINRQSFFLKFLDERSQFYFENLMEKSDTSMEKSENLTLLLNKIVRL